MGKDGEMKRKEKEKGKRKERERKEKIMGKEIRKWKMENEK